MVIPGPNNQLRKTNRQILRDFSIFLSSPAVFLHANVAVTTIDAFNAPDWAPCLTPRVIFVIRVIPVCTVEVRGFTPARNCTHHPRKRISTITASSTTALTTQSLSNMGRINYLPPSLFLLAGVQSVQC
jgi:hypothetical protein